TELNKTWFSIHFGHNEYDGDLGNEMLEYDVKSDWSGGIGFHQYLSPSFDFDAILEYGYLDYKNGPDDDNSVKANNSFGTKYINANLMLRYKLANGYIFSQDATLQPFLAAGVGVTPYFGGKDNIYFDQTGEDIDSRVGFSIPLAAGFDIRLSDKTKLVLKATYNRTFVDGFDGQAEGLGRADNAEANNIDNKGHDDFLVTSVGFKFNVGGAKDTDGDGIPDKDDRCPEVAGLPEFDGCPDTDGDGIPDIDDECPNEPGPKENNGCPVATFDFDDVNFQFDKSFVEDQFKDELDTIAETLMDDTALKITLEGHADRIGPEQYNLRLSERRAESVKSYLVGQGVSADRIFVKGLGETDPKVENANTEERRQNRRVVFNIERM